MLPKYLRLLFFHVSLHRSVINFGFCSFLLRLPACVIPLLNFLSPPPPLYRLSHMRARSLIQSLSHSNPSPYLLPSSSFPSLSTPSPYFLPSSSLPSLSLSPSPSPSLPLPLSPSLSYSYSHCLTLKNSNSNSASLPYSFLRPRSVN